MKLNVKKANSKLLILGFQQGYNRVWVAAVVSFFVAGLIYWFVFVPSNQDAWTNQGPLLIRDGAEVLFKMPNYDKQENVYVPLDEPFISYKSDRDRYELMLYGRTSERLKIYQSHTKRVGTYQTREEARKHYREIMEFLVSELAIFDGLSKSEKPITLMDQLLAYSPFMLATIIALYVLLIPVVRAELSLDRNKQQVLLKRSSLLLPRTKSFNLADFEVADLVKVEQETSVIYKLYLTFKGTEKRLFCQYRPPYKDDKLIASLSQHTRLINWWNDDEMMDKYGDAILSNKD